MSGAGKSRPEDRAGAGRKDARPGLEDAFRSSTPGPGAKVAFATAGAFLLIALAIGGLVWGGAQLGVPMFVVVLVVLGGLFGGFTLLQRSVKD